MYGPDHSKQIYASVHGPDHSETVDEHGKLVVVCSDPAQITKIRISAFSYSAF